MSLDDIRTRIEYVDGWSVAVIELNQRMDILSSCFLNGGLTDTSTIVIIQVHPEYYNNPVEDAKAVLKELKLPSDTVCFMTAAEVYHVFTVERVNYNGYDCLALVTAGLSNQVVAGEEILDWEKRKILSKGRHDLIAELYPPAGTINIIGIVSEPMTDSAKVNSFIAMTEAKTAAMNDLGYKETGTTSDAIAIVTPIGQDSNYAGTGSYVGIAMCRAVKAGVCKALIIRDDFPEDVDNDRRESIRAQFGL